MTIKKRGISAILKPRNFGLEVERALSNLRSRFRIPLPPTKKVFIRFVLCTKKDNEDAAA